MKPLPLKAAFCCILLAVAMLCLPSMARSAQELHGNAKSYICHNSSCRYYNCKNCVVIFSSRKEAEEAGFRACKVCGG